jgi:hypothetical protein
VDHVRKEEVSNYEEHKGACDENIVVVLSNVGKGAGSGFGDFDLLSAGHFTTEGFNLLATLTIK